MSAVRRRTFMGRAKNIVLAQSSRSTYVRIPARPRFMHSPDSSTFAYLMYFFGVIAIVIGAAFLVKGVKERRRTIQVFPVAYLILISFLALVFFAVSFNLAFLARFEISRPALESAVTEVRAGSMPHTPTRIGFFNVMFYSF